MSKELDILNNIKSKIHIIKGKKVMLDSNLVELYSVLVGHLNRVIKRNEKRFPKDFCFLLTKKEFENLKSQNVMASFCFYEEFLKK